VQNTVSKSVENCGKYYAAVKRCSGEEIKYLVFPTRCKSWDCPVCRPIKAKEYRNRISLLFDGRQLYFYTLTYRHFISADLAWATYNDAWNRLRTNLTRQFGKYEFVRVLESHKESPYPHLHVITDCYFPPVKFGPAAVRAGFGYQMRSSKIDRDDAYSYLLKYLTKEWKNREGWELRKQNRCRLITFSRGIKKPIVESGSWSLVKFDRNYENCKDAVLVDATWNPHWRTSIISEIDCGGLYQLVCVCEVVPDGFYSRKDDDWKPDG